MSNDSTLKQLADQGVFDIRLTKEDLASVAVQNRLELLKSEERKFKKELKVEQAKLTASGKELAKFIETEISKATKGLKKTLGDFYKEVSISLHLTTNRYYGDYGQDLNELALHLVEDAQYVRARSNWNFLVDPKGNQNLFIPVPDATYEAIVAKIEELKKANAPVLKAITSLHRKIDNRANNQRDIATYERKVKAELTKLAVQELSTGNAGVAKLLGIGKTPAALPETTEDLDEMSEDLDEVR